MRIESLHQALAHFPDHDGLWNSADLTTTEFRIRQALEALHENQSPAHLELLTQLAHVQALQGQIAPAKVTLDLCRQILNEKTGLEPYRRAELRWRLEQGRLFCLNMTPSRAQELFAQVWTLAQEQGEAYFAIDAALMLSTIRPPKFQNEWLLKAVQVAEASTDPIARSWLPHLYMMDGWHAFDFRQFEKALESFDRALALPSAPMDITRTHTLRWSRGRTLRALGRIDEALALQESLCEEMRKLGPINGHVHLEIAECKQLLKATEEAKVAFELAYSTLSTDGWYSDNRSEELSRMKYIYKKR